MLCGFFYLRPPLSHSFSYTNRASRIKLGAMKIHSLFALTAIGGVALFTLAAPNSTSGQDQPALPQAAPAQPAAPSLAPAQISPRPAPRRVVEDELSPQMAALITEINAQTAQIAANQVQIDAKLDALAESIRQARLLAARSGGKGAK